MLEPCPTSIRRVSGHRRSQETFSRHELRVHDIAYKRRPAQPIEQGPIHRLWRSRQLGDVYEMSKNNPAAPIVAIMQLVVHDHEQYL